MHALCMLYAMDCFQRERKRDERCVSAGKGEKMKEKNEENEGTGKRREKFGNATQISHFHPDLRVRVRKRALCTSKQIPIALCVFPFSREEEGVLKRENERLDVSRCDPVFTLS